MTSKLLGACAIASFAMLVVSAQPAAAKKVPKPGTENFLACDGQGYPERDTGYGDKPGGGNGDQGSQQTEFESSVAGLMYVRGPMVFSPTGIEKCNLALADPGFLPGQLPRKAQLLRSRAFHQVTANDIAGARMSLDEADSVVRAIPGYFDRDAFIAGSDMVRAYLLIEEDKTDEAKPLIQSLAARWPWSSIMMSDADAFSLLIDPDLEQWRKQLRASVLYDPNSLNQLVAVSAFLGDYDTVDALGGQIQNLPPADPPGLVMVAPPTNRRPLVLDTNDVGIWAYAAAVKGRPEVAKERMAAIKARIDAQLAPLPPLPDKKKYSKATLRDQEKKVEIGQAALLAWQKWQTIVELRIASPEISTCTSNYLNRRGIGDSPILPDMLVHCAMDDRERAAAKDVANMLRNNVTNSMKRRSKMALNDIFKAMPDIMRAGEFPGFRRSMAPWTLPHGFSSKQEDKTNIYTVRFQHSSAPPHVLDELSMLAAANYAPDRNADSFIILYRHFAPVQIDTGCGGPLCIVPESFMGGYVASMRVAYVNADALGPEWEPYRWRLINAAKVREDLTPKYVDTKKALTKN